jgi:hypothetical protein
MSVSAGHVVLFSGVRGVSIASLLLPASTSSASGCVGLPTLALVVAPGVCIVGACHDGLYESTSYEVKTQRKSQAHLDNSGL